MFKMKAILVASAALMFATSPIYVGGFAGFTSDQFPVPQVDPPVVPAGYAFSIWGLIYLLLLAHAGFGLFKRDLDPVWDKTRWSLIVSLTLGTSWIPVAQISPIWATILIWIMLISALVALLQTSTTKDRLFLTTPIAIYAGWLTAASFVSVALVGAGHGLLKDQIGWASVALGLTTVFASAVQIKLNKVPEFGLAIIWALIAVAVRNWGSELTISIVAIGAAIFIAILALKNQKWRYG